MVNINENIFLISLLRYYSNSLKRTLKFLINKIFINYENIYELIKFILKKNKGF